jgi:hypothetical protein
MVRFQQVLSKAFGKSEVKIGEAKGSDPNGAFLPGSSPGSHGAYGELPKKTTF